MAKSLCALLCAWLSLAAVAETPGGLIARDLYYRPYPVPPVTEGLKATVLFFFSNTCPVARRYFPRMAELHGEYSDRGVAFLAINASEADLLPEIARHARDWQAPFPVVKDVDFRVVKHFAVTRTPEVVVLDGAGTLRYQGRIDGQYRLGGAAATEGRRSLAEALDALLAGREVPEARTQAEGCMITLPYAGTGAGDEERPAMRVLLSRHCGGCHGAEGDSEIGPAMIARAHDAVASGFIPPPGPGLPSFADPDRFRLVRWLRKASPVDLAGLDGTPPTVGTPEGPPRLVWRGRVPEGGVVVGELPFNSSGPSNLFVATVSEFGYGLRVDGLSTSGEPKDLGGVAVLDPRFSCPVEINVGELAGGILRFTLYRPAYLPIASEGAEGAPVEVAIYERPPAPSSVE